MQRLPVSGGGTRNGRLGAVIRRKLTTIQAECDGKYRPNTAEPRFPRLTWRLVLGRQVGNTAFELVREDGVSWTIGRGPGRRINELIRSSFLENLPNECRHGLHPYVRSTTIH
jgi:hypothetical protein